MNDYIATFHTHLSAMRSHRALIARGAKAALAPVPRYLSASCGTCVRYQAEDAMKGAMDRDFDKIVRLCDGEAYETLFENE